MENDLINLYESKGTYAVKVEYLDLPDFADDLNLILRNYGLVYHNKHKK